MREHQHDGPVIITEVEIPTYQGISRASENEFEIVTLVSSGRPHSESIIVVSMGVYSGQAAH